MINCQKCQKTSCAKQVAKQKLTVLTCTAYKAKETNMKTCPNCGKVTGLHSSILQGCVCQYSMQAPPQPEQEPVAIVDANDDGYWADILPNRSVKVGQMLYTTPPQRTWVGLTDEEMTHAKHHMVEGAYQYSFKQGAKWAEDKLKEKNGYAEENT